MKNQYVGDQNDYVKYALLRRLSGLGHLPLTVFWMLTPDDDGPNGSNLGYLRDPARWRWRDSALYDALSAIALRPELRQVATIQREGLLPEARFVTALVSDAAAERQALLARLLDAPQPRGLLFLDPDIGLETPSLAPGRKGSSRYIYLDELSRLYQAGYSLLIYQHFCRSERGSFVAQRTRTLIEATGAQATWAVRAPHVLFLLAPQPGHSAFLAAMLAEMALAWQGILQIMAFRAAPQSQRFP